MVEANGYWYADCDPANNTDPTGLWTFTPACQGLALDAIGLLAGLLPFPFGFLASKIAWTFATAVAARAGINTAGDAYGVGASAAANLTSIFTFIPGWGQIVAALVGGHALSIQLGECIKSQ